MVDFTDGFGAWSGAGVECCDACCQKRQFRCRSSDVHLNEQQRRWPVGSNEEEKSSKIGVLFSLLWRAGASFVGPNHLGEAVRLRSVLIGVVLSGAFVVGAQVSSQSPVASSQKDQATDSSKPTLRKAGSADSAISHQTSADNEKQDADSSRDALGMTRVQAGKPLLPLSEPALKAEKPRLVPDPAALEAEVGAVDISQLARMVNEQSSVVSGQSSETPKPNADSSGSAVGMTNQNAQPGAAVPQENNTAWKQDPAAEGGNFTPDRQALKSAQELDEKVGREQAQEAAEDQGKPCKRVPSTENQVPSSTTDGTGKDDNRAAETNCGGGSKKGVKKKYDVRKIGERGVGGGMNFFSIDREIKMGAELAKEIDSQSKFFTDEKVNEYVNRLAQNLARNSDLRVPISVKVVDSEELNAFSLPGGRLYVNVGMIMAAESEAELAGIMAHEIGHIAARHATKNETKRQIWNVASIPLMFVGGPAGMAVQNVVQVAVPMTFMKFSRNAEREADLLGIEYEYAAGYDPSAMVNFFEKLQSKDKKKPNFVVRAFQTHPMSDDRLKRAQETIAEMLPEKNDYLVSTSEFDAIKARLTEMTANKLRFGTKGAKDEKPKLKTRESSSSR